MEIGIEISTSRRLDLKFETFPVAAHDELLQAITASTDKLKELVDLAVPKKTGRLATEINSRVLEYTDRITGLVQISGDVKNDYAKAGALEYGAHGTAVVREHAARLNHLFAKFIEPMTVMVRAHDRRVNIQARDFLRGPLATIEDSALADMKAAIQKAITE